MDGTLSSVRCWPAKLASAPSSSTAEERTASGPVRNRTASTTSPMACLLPGGDRLGQFAGERHSGRDRKAGPRRLPQADRLRAEDRFVVRASQRDDRLHP